MKVFLQRMNATAAKTRAKNLLHQEAATFFLPQWKNQHKFSCCHRCGEEGHIGLDCPEASYLCQYCDSTAHNVQVCPLLHRFCFRCSKFGHNMEWSRETRCVGNGRDADWLRCRSLGHFTRLPDFQIDINWEQTAKDIHAKFDPYLEVVSKLLPPIARYALELEANAECDLPWDWFRKQNRGRKRSAQDKPEVIDLANDDEDDQGSSASKYSRGHHSGRARASHSGGHRGGRGQRGGRGGHGHQPHRGHSFRGHERGQGRGHRYQHPRGRGHFQHASTHNAGQSASVAVQLAQIEAERESRRLAAIENVTRGGKSHPR
jgi:hypothetical protein